VIVAVQRNRWQLTQYDLGNAVGLSQIDVSNVENGRPSASSVTDKKIDDLFEHVELPRDGAHANYVKWWRDNSTL
jgi:DNA-binding XRE family transcriptional regulator